MSSPDLQSQNNHTEWKLLAEFLIPTTYGIETQVVDHVTAALRQFGLEAQQMDQILSAIDQALQNLEGILAPLHLRISVSGLDWEEILPERRPDPQEDSKLVGSGLGFFLVKRIVGELQDQDPARYRLIEVLIYRESGRNKGLQFSSPKPG